MDIQFEGRLSYQLFRKAQKEAGSSLGNTDVLIGALVGFGALGLFVPVVAPLVICLGILTVALIAWTEWSIWRLWKADEMIRDPFEGTLSDWGLKWASSSESHDVSWDRLSRQVNSSRILMLFESKDFFHLLAPPFFLNIEEWRAARRLARRKLDR